MPTDGHWVGGVVQRVGDDAAHLVFGAVRGLGVDLLGELIVCSDVDPDLFGVGGEGLHASGSAGTHQSVHCVTVENLGEGLGLPFPAPVERASGIVAMFPACSGGPLLAAHGLAVAHHDDRRRR